MFVPYMLDEPNECEALVVTCLDFRFQRFFERWLAENVGQRNYDRVALAGSVKDWPIIFSQIEIARRVHQVKRIVLINHEDCKAYGDEGSPERHTLELQKARQQVLEKFPELRVELYYARLAGYLERIK